MSDTVEITRYPNRRLYDRSRKKYVTLGDIESMVLGDQDVRVRDSKSDEDLTRLILTQIILERHPERMKMFPVAFLHGILRADKLGLDWLTVYFGQAMTFMDGITGSSRTTMVPSMDFWQSFMPGRAKPSPASDSLGDQTQPAQQDEEPAPDGKDGPAAVDLATRLAEMERRLKQLEGSDDRSS